MAEITTDNAGQIEPISLSDEMATSYMQFAMSTIIARALPDVRDGLKPSQRRILAAMNDDNLTPDRPHSKSAAIVGETMKTYHPHGDMPIYDTLVRMGQEFNARYPLVDPQGNFGSVDGDPAGAARYTEARLSPVAMEMLADLDKDTVDFQPTYNERNREPCVLPAGFPNLVCNGSSGIAVGYATNIPPHNAGEVIDAAIALLGNPGLTPAQLMRYIHGPDFPTGALVLGMKGIRSYFETGRGSVTMQARAFVEPLDRAQQAIVVTELPYQVGKSALLQQIAALVSGRKIEGISDIRDESDRKGMRVVIELRREANAQVVLNQLYKRTNLRVTFGANLLALVPTPEGRLIPRLCTIKDLLEEYLRHRRQVVTRRTQWLLTQAEARLHIVEGLLKAIDIIDEVIALIRGSETRTAARGGLMSQFGFSERQAEEILNMQLGRLTRLSRDELEKEHDDLVQRIAEYRQILGSEEVKSEVIRRELRDVKRRHSDERRTRIIPEEADNINIEDLIAQEDMTITITRDGYIKRLPLDTYRVQRRGGRGVIALSKKEEDTVQDLFVATTHHLMLCFTDRGRVYRVKAYEVPPASRTSRGTPIVNIVPLEPGEAITAMIPIEGFHVGGYLVMVTAQGVIKKTALEEFDSVYKTKGINAISLADGDQLKWVLWSDGTRDIMLVTRYGKALRFDEAQVRPMGRTAAGMAAIKLREGDSLVAAVTVRKDDRRDLLVVAEKGLGKRTPLTEYTPHARNTQGQFTISITEKNGCVCGVAVVNDDDEVMCITSEGVLIRVPVEQIRRTGRSAQGVKVATPAEGSVVCAVVKVVQHVAESPDETS